MGKMIEVKNEKDMQSFGERVGRLLRGGEIIELVGDVGAGKTTFVRGLAAGMGVNETVQSPSFTVSRLYDAMNELQLVHYDFYRLSDPGIMVNELVETVTRATNVTVIEWSDTIKSILPRDRLTMTISSLDDNSRSIGLHSGGAASKSLEEQIQ